MNSRSIITAAASLLLALTFFAPAAMLPTAAAASDDDIICFDYPMPNGGSETECDTRGNYKAECKLSDPDNTSQFCKDVNSASLFRPTGFAVESGTPNTHGATRRGR